MSVHPRQTHDGFGPPEIAAMVCAHQDALRMLGVVDRSGALSGLIAKRIIELAQQGERDAARLRDRALKVIRDQGQLAD